MRVIAIHNPIAGAHRQHSSMRAMLNRLRAMGIEAEAWATAGPGDGTRLARRAAGIEADAETDAGSTYVIAGGGDGTVREVVEGLAGTKVPLMIWPTGTENLVAKSLGFRAEPELIPACLTAGETAVLDTGTANGRCFLVVAGMGFDAEVVNRLVGGRRGHITHLSYAGPIWRTFWTHRFPPMRIIHEGRIWWEGQGMVFVGNMSRYSLGLPVVRDARPDDGLLDLLVLPCRGHVKLLAHSIRTVFGRHVEHGGAQYLRFTRIRIESQDAVPVELDGDSAGWLPLEVQVQPRALCVRLPPG